MTLTLELTAEEEHRLEEKAKRAGLAPVDLLRQFIAEDGQHYDPTSDPAYSDEWTDEDMRDFTAAAMRRIDEVLGPEDDYNA
jgi:hypothetical protein